MIEKPLTEQEAALIDELRQAKQRSKRKPETFLIRVVDGILQLQITIPFNEKDDRRHLDNRQQRR